MKGSPRVPNIEENGGVYCIIAYVNIIFNGNCRQKSHTIIVMHDFTTGYAPHFKYKIRLSS